MSSRKDSSSCTSIVIVDGLLNYILFATLANIFWYGVEIIFKELVIDGETDPRERAFAMLVITASFEVWIALDQHRLNAIHREIRDNTGYGKFFVLTRCYNCVLAMTDGCLFLSIQTFYTEYVGDVEADVHAYWCAAILAVSLAARVSRTLICSPFEVILDGPLEEEWLEFSLYFKTTPASEFVLRLYDAIFSVLGVSLILDSYFYTLTFAFDGYIYPSDFVMAMLVSCAAGYVIIALAKLLTPAATAASVELERRGETLGKLVVEDVIIFAANFGTILLWKGLTMFAQLLSEALGPVVGLSPRHMAIVNQFLAFAAMCLLGITSSLVYKGPGIDGEMTKGAGLVFPTDYFNVQPKPHQS